MAFFGLVFLVVALVLIGIGIAIVKWGEATRIDELERRLREAKERVLAEARTSGGSSSECVAAVKDIMEMEHELAAAKQARAMWPWLILRVSLGVVLLLLTSLLAVFCICAAFTSAGFFGIGGFLFFGLQTYAVWRILLFRGDSGLRNFHLNRPPPGGDLGLAGAAVPRPSGGRPPTLSAAAEFPDERKEAA